GLALWRGAALADVAGSELAELETRRLDELRLVATMDRVDADLALGRSADLVPELEQLSAAHPLQERLHGQLMLALYRCGRGGDALGASRALRAGLDDELGLEPSRGLQELERAILQHDRRLDLAPVPVRGADALTGSEVVACPYKGLASFGT